MAYVVKKKIYGNEYYYLRESVREGSKVKSIALAYFGKTKPTDEEVKKKLEEIRLKKTLEEKPEKAEVEIEVEDINIEKKDTSDIIKEYIKEPKHRTLITIDEMYTFCKKKGFVFPNSEIYGGLAGFFDYGPLGVELKNNIKADYWKTFVQQREDVVGIDGSIISHPKVWEASGHAANFTDYIYECDKCKILVKGDNDKGAECTKCKQMLGNPKKFNLMFKTQIGPFETKDSTAYLRPETAQLIFTNFKNVMDTARQKLPFGIAQIGKAFRNEISPREFLFRVREFEQAEIEFFTHPDRINDCAYFSEIEDMEVNIITAEAQNKNEAHIRIKIKDLTKLTSKWHAYWIGIIYKWFTGNGIIEQNIRIREHLKEELAHYATACFDLEYNFPFGWREIHGNADRKQFDLNQHINSSKKDLSVYDEETKQKVVPYVASEPSQGIDRAFLTFMFEAYHDDKERGNIVLYLSPNLAPIKVGVFPLVNKLEEKAEEVFTEIKSSFNAMYDRSGSVGRRYARADEIGIPYCVTIDFDTLNDNSVTIRDRDTTKQIRVKIENIKEILWKLLNQQIEFE